MILYLSNTAWVVQGGNEGFWFAEELRVQYISSMRVGSTEAGLLTTASIRRPYGDGDERARSEFQKYVGVIGADHAVDTLLMQWLCAEGRAPHAHIRGRVFGHVQRSWTPPGKYIIDYCNMVLGNEDAYIRDLQYGVQRRGRQGLRFHLCEPTLLSGWHGRPGILVAFFDILVVLV